MENRTPKTISAKELDRWLRSSSQKPLLIDVREDAELEIASIDNEIVHLPLSKASEWIETLHERLPRDQALVVLCHAGIRSMQFCTWLLENGFEQEIWNLEGGIDTWSIDVDQTVARY